MFSIYINDIITCSDKFKFIMYADKTTLLTTANVFDKQMELSLSINNEFAKVNDWLRVNKLSLNVNKTKAMVFHMPQKKMLLPQLNIAGMAIEFVNYFNFLGIKIDTNLNWLSHTHFLANKILKTAGVLNKLRDILPQSVLTAIYFSLIEPGLQCHLSYGILAWGHQSNRLFKLQKRILRIITCSPYISHNAPLFKKLGI